MKFAPFILFLLIFSCKSTQKLFDEGNYEKAIYSSIDDLKKNPSNTNAQQLLSSSYDEASRKILADIGDAKASRKPDQLDRIYNDYQVLQKFYTSITSLAPARNAVNAIDYSADLRSAAEEAAEFHYNRGQDYLQAGDRKGAQNAYEDFKLTDSYSPGYKDVLQLKDKAYDLAVTNVALNTVRQQFGYSVNSSFFENDLLWELKKIGRDQYYSFYTVSDARYKNIRVDQFIDLSMNNVWFGNMITSNYSYNVSKEISEPATNPKDPPVKRTVTATINVTRHRMEATGSLDCRITDADNRRIVYSGRFPARYTWENLTGTYNGDLRALSNSDNAIINGIYSNPPDYDELYRELTKQIMNDFNYKMRQLYGR